MKKIYMMPEIQVVKVKLGSMITTSDPKATVDPNDYVDAGDVESRRYNAWGDEDEDEEDE